MRRSIFELLAWSLVLHCEITFGQDLPQDLSGIERNSEKEPEYQSVAPKSKVVLRPVTKRIVKEYLFPNRETAIGELRFSPDGKRLFAADYPGGVFVVWDVKTAEALVQVETGQGFRSRQEYIHFPANWKAVYVLYDSARKIEALGDDGKQGIRASYDRAIRGWSLDTGKEVANLRNDPPHGGDFAILAPDESWMVTSDEIPGVFSMETFGSRKNVATIWDLDSKTSSPIGEPGDLPIYASSEGRYLAMAKADGSGIAWYEVITRKPLWTYKPAKDCGAGPICSASDGKGLVFVEMLQDLKKNSILKTWVKIVDRETGAEKSSYEIKDAQGVHARVLTNSQGRTLFELVEFETTRNSLFYRDVRVVEEKDGSFQELFRIEFPRDNPKVISSASPLKVSPDGTFAAFTLSELPSSGEELVRLTALDLPQPQLWFVDMASGKIFEKLDLPQAYANSLAFSPDGRSLAVSGYGRVLSLEVSDLTKSKK